MYKTSILKKLVVISNSSLNLLELKKRYSFLKYKNFFNKKILILINSNEEINQINHYHKKNFLKKSNDKILIGFDGRRLIIENSIFEYKIKIYIDKNIPNLDLINILDDLILIKLIQSKFLPIHSSGFSLNKIGKLFASYGGVGKTRIVLEALKFSDKSRIFDEWCLIKNSTLYPLRKDVLLMDYDISENQKFFNKFDLYRAKISMVIPFKKLNNILRILRLSLPFKYVSFKNVSLFNIKNIFFISQKNNVKTKFKKIKKNFFAKKILNNFKHEKNRLFRLVLVNNSIKKFNNKINLAKTYHDLLIKLLKNCKFKKILIDKNNKNFNSLFLKILQDD